MVLKGWIEMKILIIGGVAAGTKTAAKLKRADRSAQVTVLTKGKDISYAGCGLPYYVGGLIADRGELIVNTPQKFADLTGVEVVTGMEAIKVDSAAKTVTAKQVETGAASSYAYDKLVIATGASPILPNIEGIGLDGVFAVRTPDDAIAIRDFVSGRRVNQAVVIGGGFIGLEMAEHLKGYWPNQLSFSESCGMVMRMLMTLQGASPGRIPELMGGICEAPFGTERDPRPDKYKSSVS